MKKSLDETGKESNLLDSLGMTEDQIINLIRREENNKKARMEYNQREEVKAARADYQARRNEYATLGKKLAEFCKASGLELEEVFEILRQSGK